MATNILSSPTDIRKIIDLSDVIGQIQNYPKGQSIALHLSVDGHQMTITVYPQGDNQATQGYVSLYLKIDNIAGDKRQIAVSMKCGSNVNSVTGLPASHFIQGQGWKNAFKMDEITANPQIEFQIKVHARKQDENAMIPTHIGHLQKMFDLTMETGDITLRVEIISDEDTLSSPPIKRRRVCNGEGSDESTASIVKVSSVILRASSPVFDQMMTTEMKEKEEKVITIHAKTLKSVKDLVYYMCTGQLRKDANALHLLPLSHLYQMDPLYWLCSQKMIRDIAIGNFVETVKTLDKYDIQQGFEFVAEYGRSNITKLCKRDDFVGLPCSFRTLVLKHEGDQK